MHQSKMVCIYLQLVRQINTATYLSLTTIATNRFAGSTREAIKRQSYKGRETNIRERYQQTLQSSDTKRRPDQIRVSCRPTTISRSNVQSPRVYTNCCTNLNSNTYLVRDTLSFYRVTFSTASYVRHIKMTILLVALGRRRLHHDRKLRKLCTKPE